jgi:rare lipoprotein A
LPDRRTTAAAPSGLAGALVIIAVIAVSACASVPRGSKAGVETGLASWYGNEFQGRPTSSGEVFDTNDMTAAHRTLPFGTNVMVTNLENERSVVVRINDRGPFIAGRIIDLSYAAARVLGIVGPGTARVRMETLRGSGAPRENGAAAVWIQVGAFSVQENAYALKRRLETSYPGVAVVRLKTDRGVHYRVRVKPEAGSVEKTARRLAAEGYSVIIVRE